MTDRRTRVRLEEVLNGRWEALDPDVRLGLSVMGDQIDGFGDALRNEIEAAEGRVHAQVSKASNEIAASLQSINARLDLNEERGRNQAEKLAAIQKLLYTVGGITLTFLLGILATLLTRGL